MRLQCSSSMGDAVTAPESEHEFLVLSEQMYDGLPGPITGRSVDAQSVPALDRTAWYSTVQYSRVPEGVPGVVTDSIPEPRDSGSDSQESVSGGGGCADTDRIVPLTSDVCLLSLSPPARGRWVKQWAPMAWLAGRLPRVTAQGMP